MATSQLVRQIGEPERHVQLRQGVITAVPASDGTVSVRLGGVGATAVAGVRRLGSAPIVNGATVWVLQQGYDLLVIGPVASTVTAVTDRNLLRVGNSYVGSHPVHSASAAPASNWASFGHWDKQGTSDYAFMQNAEGRVLINASAGQSIRLGIAGSASDMVSFDGISFNVRNINYVGPSQAYGTNYAQFSHWAYRADSNYGFMMQDNGTVFLSSPGTIYLRQSNANRFQVDSQVHTSVKLNVSGGLQIWTGTLQINGNAALNWASHGGNIWMQDGTWIRFDKRIYTANNYIRSDAALVAPSATGSVGVQLKQEGDNTHRVYHWGGQDGCSLDSWSFACVRSIQYDVMLEAGRGFANRHVNLISSAWRYSDAQGHTNFSDPRFKTGIRRLTQKKDRVRAIKPIEFKWDKKHDKRSPGHVNFGFSADDLPAECIHMGMLIDEETGEPTPVKMMDPVGVLALLWEAVLEMADEADADRAKRADVERRVDAIERLPIVGVSKKDPAA